MFYIRLSLIYLSSELKNRPQIYTDEHRSEIDLLVNLLKLLLKSVFICVLILIFKLNS